MKDNPVYLTKFAAKNIIFLSQHFEKGYLINLGYNKTCMQFNK